MTKKLEAWGETIDQWLWQAQHSRDSRLTKGVWHSSRVLFAVVRDILYGNITLHAMGLVYTSLLSLIPFLALMFSVLTALGVHNQLEPVLENFLEPLGDLAPIITENVLHFVDNIQVGVLGFAGMGFLIYTVISLIQKIEQAFNEIWRVSQLRSIGQRFSNYLSVIIIGPVLVVSALGTTGTIVASDLITEIRQIQPFGLVFSIIGLLSPYFMVIALFTFLYTFIPNTRVKLRYAFVGGAVGGVVWQWTSLIFAEFVASSTRYEAIYSSFVVGILFLWWLFLSWTILLVGASVSFYSQHAQQITRARRYEPSAVVDEQTGLAIMFQVARQFDTNGGASAVADIESDLSVGPEVMERLTRKLIKHKLLVSTADGSGLLPARSLDKVLLNELIEVLRAPHGTVPHALADNPAVQSVAIALKDAVTAKVGQLTLADWVRDEWQPPSGSNAEEAGLR